MPAREPDTGPHQHGRVGWQHLAFAVESRGDVDRMHDIATGAGWAVIRDPKEYPRFTDRYYASFVEDDMASGSSSCTTLRSSWALAARLSDQRRMRTTEYSVVGVGVVSKRAFGR